MFITLPFAAIQESIHLQSHFSHVCIIHKTQKFLIESEKEMICFSIVLKVAAACYQLSFVLAAALNTDSEHRDL